MNNLILTFSRLANFGLCCFLVLAATPLTSVVAKGPKNITQELLESADGYLAQFPAIEGDFEWSKKSKGGEEKQVQGHFRVLRQTNDPAVFELNFAPTDRKPHGSEVDGAGTPLRVWSDGTTVFCRNSNGPVKACGVFRGGIQLLESDALSVASPFIQPGFFEKLVSYRPTQDPNRNQALKMREITVEAPGRKWAYRFSTEKPELLGTAVISGTEEDRETVTIRYSNVKYKKQGSWSPSGPEDSEEVVQVGPHKQLLGSNLSSTKVDWNLDTARQLEDCRGKIVVIDFWASWCAPCMKEMPAFLSLTKKYSSDDVVFICSPWRDSESSIMRAAKNGGFENLVHQVDAESFQLEKLGIPCQFVLDREGRLADFITGSHGIAGKRHLKNSIDSLLEK